MKDVQKNGIYSYGDFLEIIKILRSENGCPWDREQTHVTLRPCLMEEAAEVMAAIRIYDRTGDYENLREELGDVLLQVVMHAEIAGEEGIFTMEDVVNEVAEKMVRRHPHVFGDTQADSSGQVLENWEEIKNREKGHRAAAAPLKEIPVELPSLVRAGKVLKKIDKLYQPGPDYAEALRLLKTAVDRLPENRPREYDEETAGQIGEALIAMSHIANLCRLSAEQILTDYTDDLIEKYEP